MLKVKPVPKIIFLISICAVFAVCFAFFVTQPKPIQSGEKQALPDTAFLHAKYLKYLSDTLESKDPLLLSADIELLGGIRDSSVTPGIKKHLQSKSKIVIMEAARAIARYGDNSGVPELIKVLNEKTWDSGLKTDEKMRRAAANPVREKAAEYLGEIGDKRALESLKNVSKENEGRIKDAALVALIKLGEKSQVDVFNKRLESGFESAIEKSANVPGNLRYSGAASRLRGLLKKNNKNIKSAAVAALGKMGDTESAETIRTLLKDKNAIMRASAAEALGNIKDLNSLEALKNALKDNNLLVRLKAAEALMKLGDDSGERFIESSVKTGNMDTRLKAVRILSEYGKKNIISALGDTFENENNRRIRMEIAAATIKIINREE